MEDRMSGFCFTKPVNVRGGSGGGCGGGGGGGSTGTKCGRWNPTSEQVKVLTDLFRSGLRTPSTDQIQKISSQLSFYGKIESKNVFYWFQNHKARERQKRRRVSVDDHHHQNNKDHLIRRQDSTLSSSARYFAEINQVSEQERVIETLQLFPINTFNEGDHHAEKFRYHQANNEWKENTTFSCNPPLDLRLSFL